MFNLHAISISLRVCHPNALSRAPAVSNITQPNTAAHEIEYSPGLHHTWEDQARLLHPGRYGIALSEEKRFFARYAARGLIDEQR